MHPERTLVWFRNDLRLHDHEPLCRALSRKAEIIPLFIVNERLWEPHPLGFPRAGAHRLKFLFESVEDLRLQLRSKGADLLIRVGKPEEIIPSLVGQLGASAVYASKEVAWEEEQEEILLEKALLSQGTNFQLFWERTLLHLEDIPWPVGHLPENFTAFRKSVEEHFCVRPLFPAPDQIPFACDLPSGEWPMGSTLPAYFPPADTRAVLGFKGGESFGLQRVQQYIWEEDALKEYKETRNGLLGANYSSKFSPWLALGCLSPRHIYEEVKRYEIERVKNESTYWLVFELLWRDYFRLAAKKYGRSIFYSGGLPGKKRLSPRQIAGFTNWCMGQTGHSFVDANMRELLHTGYMSNRGRQNVASYLCHDLRLDWTWGAAWFESRLIDYDVSSNWLNWSYLAGVGLDPRPNRYFHVEAQAQRYDPAGTYRQLWAN